ncbi:MAG: UDP-N-acetylmuramoyl-L-alanyl-D-glutamate--2,6-diaminopimelate ligase [Deltaproteobacteria bacterium]
MRLKQLIKVLDSFKTSSDLGDFEVAGVDCNSKKISRESIFVAIKGNRENGHKFIGEAIEKGARLIITQDSYPEAGHHKEKVSFIEVPDTRMALAKLAGEFYGNPSREIKVIGITGTNGKTTVSYLLEALLQEGGINTAVIGTVNYRFNGRVLPSINTTPGPVEIQSMLAMMQNDGVGYVAMEVSSHALDQGRTEGINFHSAIFTNLTQDHLDYHGTLENYFFAKSALFKKLPPASFAVINNDDSFSSRLKDETRVEKVTYGLKAGAEVTAQDIRPEVSHTEFTLCSGRVQERIRTRLIGEHNVYNILAAASWAMKEGMTLTTIKSAFDKFNGVPGRLERIDFPGDFSVFVDYAHTDDALANVIRSLRKISSGKIIVVFGCGGERDKTKRPKMGKVVSELADSAIITSDNPRSEPPEEIIDAIKSGISKGNYRVIADRRDAIKESLSAAGVGDIVLVAGKGHENYQIFKDRTIDFDDREVIKECLRSLRS